MKNLIIFTFTTLLGLSAMGEKSHDHHVAPTLAQTKNFGAQIDLSKKPLTVEAVLKSPNDFKGKKILLTGKVEKVCKQSGCWITLNDGKNSLMTRFKDYGFTVPKDIEGKTVVCEGEVDEKTMSVAEQRHYLKDAGEPKEKIDAVKESKKEYGFIADGVIIK